MEIDCSNQLNTISQRLFWHNQQKNERIKDFQKLHQWTMA
jgi:hypothetical protein